MKKERARRYAGLFSKSLYTKVYFTCVLFVYFSFNFAVEYHEAV